MLPVCLQLTKIFLYHQGKSDNGFLLRSAAAGNVCTLYVCVYASSWHNVIKWSDIITTSLISCQDKDFSRPLQDLAPGHQQQVLQVLSEVGPWASHWLCWLAFFCCPSVSSLPQVNKCFCYSISGSCYAHSERWYIHKNDFITFIAKENFWI